MTSRSNNPGVKPSHIKFIGEDKAVITVIKEERPHWSELPTPVNIWPPRDFGDNDKSDPEQNLEEKE